MTSEKGFSLWIMIIAVAVVAVLGGGTYVVVREAEASAAEMAKLKVKKTPKATAAPKVMKKTVPLKKPFVLPKPSPAPRSTTHQTGRARDPWRDPIPPAPTNLRLPMSIQDIQESDGVISPYGIIRHSRDGGIGHGGIDFPLKSGSPMYAVANGTIIKNSLEDAGGGNTVDILMLPSEFPGEGWIFTYEHMTVEPWLAVGSMVEQGQKIGVNALLGRGNNHVGLEYKFKNFAMAREKRCWVDRLEPTARQQLESAFNRIKKTPAFIQSWQTANEAGYYQYKGFLDETTYPTGPQLCYPLGTDARISIN